MDARRLLKQARDDHEPGAVERNKMRDWVKFNHGRKQMFDLLNQLKLPAGDEFEILGRALASTLSGDCAACFEKNLTTLNSKLREHYAEHGVKQCPCGNAVKH